MTEQIKEIRGILAVLDPCFPLDKSIRYSGLELFEDRGWRILTQESIGDPSPHTALILDFGNGVVKLCPHTIRAEFCSVGSETRDGILRSMGMQILEESGTTNTTVLLRVPKTQSVLDSLVYLKNSGITTSLDLIFVQAVVST